MKKFTAMLLCVIMVMSLVPMSAFAASGTLVYEEELAEDLKLLGLFKGVSETDFALGRAPTRVEALVMLIRVLGKENDALSKGGKHPFLDVPDWAKKYVGYAYENNLTNGVSATKFGSTTEASASMYLTFVLRALGYSDKNGDFTWDNPFALARETGIMKGNPNVMKFLRADVVLVSYAALEAEVKGTGKTLAQKLIEAGAFSKSSYDEVYNVSAFENADKDVSLTSEEIYKKCSPAVFYIETYDAKGNATGSGSGFFIASDGTAVTNFHVIEGVASAKIRTTDGRVYKVSGVYDFDSKNDWAILKIDGNNFPYLEIEKGGVTGGQTVYAIGSPIGLENTISEGLISNADRIIDGIKYIQISVPISPGSSGGALINKNGKVVGITSAGFSEGQNLNLAMPISVINGHEKQRAAALSTISSGKKDLGQIDTSDLTVEGMTAELICRWVYKNTNRTVNGDPAYSVEKTYSNGDVEGFVVTFSEEDGIIALIVVYMFEDGTTISTVLGIEADNPNVIAEYYYYNDASDSYASVTGSATIDKRLFYSNMNQKFSETNAYSERTLHERNANTCWLSSVKRLNDIVKSELSGYGIDSLTRLGFTNIER